MNSGLVKILVAQQCNSFHDMTRALKATKWRLFEIRLAIRCDPGKDSYETSEQLCCEVAAKLGCKVFNTAATSTLSADSASATNHFSSGNMHCKLLGCLLQTQTLPLEAVSVVRKSFDARAKQRNFVYVVDVDAAVAAAAGAAPRFKQGQIERWILHRLMRLPNSSSKPFFNLPQ